MKASIDISGRQSYLSAFLPNLSLISTTCLSCSNLVTHFCSSLINFITNVNYLLSVYVPEIRRESWSQLQTSSFSLVAANVINFGMSLYLIMKSSRNHWLYSNVSYLVLMSLKILVVKSVNLNIPGLSILAQIS